MSLKDNELEVGDVDGIIDSRGTESGLSVVVTDPVIVAVAVAVLAAEGDEAPCTEPLVPEPGAEDTFRCGGPINVPSKGEVT